MLAMRSDLPVSHYRREILDTIARSSVTLIRGQTGCGKTTQVPQFILDDFVDRGQGANCAVVVTQVTAVLISYGGFH